MKITVIGEICKDIFIYGDTNRLSPEAPVPVFIPRHNTENLGMSGNVYNNLKSMNPDIDVNIISNSNNITKKRFIDDKSNHMFIRVDEGDENVEPLEMNDDIVSMITNSDAVIVSDYNKNFLNENTLLTIGKLSKFCVLDEKGHLTDSIVKSFDFIKVNEHEYKKNMGILNRFIYKVIITLGIKGSMWGGELFEPPQPKETIDVSGAGDTFTAAFTLKYLETKNTRQSIIFANEMASIVVAKRGVATP